MCQSETRPGLPPAACFFIKGEALRFVFRGAGLAEHAKPKGGRSDQAEK